MYGRPYVSLLFFCAHFDVPQILLILMLDSDVNVEDLVVVYENV